VNPLFLPWGAEAVIITYRAFAGKSQDKVKPISWMPVPADYTATFIVFGALSFVPGEQLGKVAVIFGWGIVVATFLNLWDPTTGKVSSNNINPTAKQGATT
jgi:hypothetical protein